jgi:hypothetical protein
MRALLLLPLFALLAGCLAPGERDPTRYPWDQPAPTPAPHPRIEARGMISPNPDWQPQPQPVRPQGSYCIMAIERESRSGIKVGGQAPGVMACSAPANSGPTNPAPAKPPR